MNFTNFINFITVSDCSARVACGHGTGERAYLNPAAPLRFYARYQLVFSENGDMNNLPCGITTLNFFEFFKIHQYDCFTGCRGCFYSALPGGYRNNNGNFNNLGNNANFWSATENNTNNAWNRNLNYNNSDVNRNNNNKQNGFSVRLVRD